MQKFVPPHFSSPLSSKSIDGIEMKSNMESLISAYNKLQNLQTSLGRSATEGVNLTLPQIVVVGGQSAGKSSVLEGFVGRDFLPRGSGIVTRVPLVLQLVHTPKNSNDGVEEWGQFLHNPGQKFTDFDEIREEIDAETAKLAGSSEDKGVVDKPINLTIYSPTVVNITLVDLPGVVTVPLPTQPKDIEAQVRSMILNYIKPENVIILAVTPINADMATSEALKLAKIVDPEGKRTLAVLTKLDLMDPGTDANEAMAGRVIPVKLGIIGVVNRSQQNIKDKKSIEDCLKHEKKFFLKKYPDFAARSGTPFLARKLNTLLMEHLKSYLPTYKVLINKKIAQKEESLTVLGEEILPENKHKMLRELISKVVKEFCGRIDGQAMPDFAEGTAGDMKLSGGAKINRDIFYGSFKEDLDEIIPLADVTQVHIIHRLRLTAGLQPHVFVSDEVFMELARKEVRRLSKPSERCVERVHDELRALIEKYGPECKHDFDRFPRCRDKIIGITQEFVGRTKNDALLLVKDLVNIQTGFINTRHKDFQEEAAVLLSTQQRRRLEQEEAKKKAEQAKKDWADDGHHPKSFHAMAAMKALGEKQKNRGEGSGDADRWLAEEREMEDGDMMRELTQKYFGIARDAIEDGVPKAIFQKLIQPVKNGLQTELYEELVVSGLGTDLLEETGDVEASRKEAKHTLAGLLQAFDIIKEVREFNV